VLRAGRTARELIGFFLILLGLGGLLAIGLGGTSFYITRNWVKADAVVTRNWTTSQAVSRRSSEGNGPEPRETILHIEFRYKVNGREFVAPVTNTYGEDKGYLVHGDVNIYSPGSAHAVYYNPARPNEIVLGKGSSLSLLVLIALGAGTQIFTFVGWRLILRSRRSRVHAGTPRGARQQAPVDRLQAATGGLRQIAPTAGGEVRNRTGNDVVRVVGLFFAIPSLAALGLGVFVAYEQYKVITTWRTVTAQETQTRILTSSSYDSEKDKSTTLYTPEITMQYTVEGKDYISKVGTDVSSSQYDSARVRIDANPPGTRQTVWYNPARPRETAIEAGYTTEFFAIPLIACGIGLIGTFIGFAVILGAARNRARVK
jgi:Protein of unknown function (DUF3592)